MQAAEAEYVRNCEIALPQTPKKCNSLGYAKSQTKPLKANDCKRLEVVKGNGHFTG